MVDLETLKIFATWLSLFPSDSRFKAACCWSGFYYVGNFRFRLAAIAEGLTGSTENDDDDRNGDKPPTLTQGGFTREGIACAGRPTSEYSFRIMQQCVE